MQSKEELIKRGRELVANMTPAERKRALQIMHKLAENKRNRPKAKASN
ncbi:hypothetical protein AGMMS49543_24700 [Betaproteobacteria bacterium]|nr:hypothetical protein AGMMS49543_24700 [Betaproteobacteria bacterium]GHU10615.1 hypothetical protein AGMMS50225_14460 [Betaproteobacteria bacterium]GHU17269.1 hypothetical protein AGMMS50243_05180 [Betaproteobacteria bacterium]GHU30111.1 hypothetical protein FACS189497_09340 [Betaproteobacteria bacterium]